MKSLLKFIIGCSLAFGHLIFRGVVVRDLWYWFVVPLGLPALSLAHAIGLSGTIFYITYAIRTEPESDKPFFQKFISSVITAYITSLISWGMGWAVVQYM